MSGNFHDEQGRTVAEDHPERLLWYGMCSYWTDDWDHVAVAGSGIPCCPRCGSPGFQITAREWFDGARRFESEGHPGYFDFLNDSIEECHGRDYQERIQDSARLIPDDEPVLLIRGQDLAAIPAARAWCLAAVNLGADPAMIRMVEEHINRIDAWQRGRACKVPDLPERP